MSTAGAAIELDRLSKTYAGGKRALDDVSLSIPRGSIYGLLGPNGAGKSTTINILAGLVIKTSGRARVWGFDIDEHPRNARAAIGVVPQELMFDAFFTPFETLEIQAGMYGVPRNRRRSMELLRAMHLDDKANSYSRTLSGGMKRRLLIAKALVHNPPVIILDEPTAGVDVELRQQLWSYVRELHARGTTIVLTTHYLEEAQELCDRIAIVNHGRIVAEASTPDLLALAHEKRVTVTVASDLRSPPILSGVTQVDLLDSRRLDIFYDRTRVHAGAVLSRLAEEGIEVVDVSTREADLETVFLQLTGAST